jgi:hypothetical protein
VPSRLTVAPFVAAGWSDVPPANVPWTATGDPRVSVGVALEWLGLIRFDFGYGLGGGEFTVLFDLSRDFWPIL